MFSRISHMIFIVVFLLMIAVPLITTNLHNGKISEAENRVLASKAELFKEDGSINRNFNKDFETWINDNIGQRSKMIVANAKIQYYLFNLLSNNSDMYLGPNGELNYATQAMIKDFQHLNLHSEEYLLEVADSFQILNDYVEKEGSLFYYYQCWDKHSVYPEYFPKGVLQIGIESKTDGIVKALKKYTSISVISPKEELLRWKTQKSTYSVWGDATHWNQRGAYIGYQKLMNTINSESSIKYKVLQESDYNITRPDQGSTLFGGIHEVDYIENFEIKNTKAVLTNDKLTLYSDDQRHRFYTNNAVDNKTRILVLGDSYFNSFILDDIAESFYETIIIWGDYLSDFQNIIDTYNADIVIVENAERCDRSQASINAVNNMKNNI